MEVVVLAKALPRRGDFLGELLATGRTRRHRVQVAAKPAFLRTDLHAVDVVCLKNHVDDDRVWRAVQDAGVRVVNTRLPWTRRAEVEAVAAAAGIRTPRSARDDREVAGLRYPVIRKSASMLAAADVVLIERPPARPDCTTYFYQEYVPHGGVTSKVYCVGSQAFLVESQDDPLSPGPRDRQTEIPAFLARTARSVGAALGLEVYGVDFVGHGHDQYVVDVNPFPSFRHVTRAADALWDYLEGTT